MSSKLVIQEGSTVRLIRRVHGKGRRQTATVMAMNLYGCGGIRLYPALKGFHYWNIEDVERVPIRKLRREAGKEKKSDA